MAERLTWLLNGCYLWEGEVDNIAHSRFTPPTTTPPPPEMLVVMAVMTEKTNGRQKRNSGNRGEILEWGRQKKYLRCEMPENEEC